MTLVISIIWILWNENWVFFPDILSPILNVNTKCCSKARINWHRGLEIIYSVFKSISKVVNIKYFRNKNIGRPFFLKSFVKTQDSILINCDQILQFIDLLFHMYHCNTCVCPIFGQSHSIKMRSLLPYDQQPRFKLKIITEKTANWTIEHKTDKIDAKYLWEETIELTNRTYIFSRNCSHHSCRCLFFCLCLLGDTNVKFRI